MQLPMQSLLLPRHVFRGIYSINKNTVATYYCTYQCLIETALKGDKQVLIGPRMIWNSAIKILKNWSFHRYEHRNTSCKRPETFQNQVCHFHRHQHHATAAALEKLIIHFGVSLHIYKEDSGTRRLQPCHSHQCQTC